MIGDPEYPPTETLLAVTVMEIGFVIVVGPLLQTEIPNVEVLPVCVPSDPNEAPDVWAKARGAMLPTMTTAATTYSVFFIVCNIP